VAQWAAFFDVACWKWAYQPLDLPGWLPEFYVEFPCRHSECGGPGSFHNLLVEVKPYFKIADFHGHQCMNERYLWGIDIPADACAAFGAHPKITYWAMCHGAGGGDECVERWVLNAMSLWIEAERRIG
jgi:hypothetical protein